MIPETEKITVPWKGFDVLFFFALWIMALCVIHTVVLRTPSSVQPQTQAADQKDHRHQIVQMIEQGKHTHVQIVFLLAFLTTVVIVPFFEEFLFRLLLQGWFEAKLRQCQIPGASGIAIVTVSLGFAALHGSPPENFGLQTLLYASALISAFYFGIVALGLIYLARIRNVKIVDHLFGTERFFRPGFFTVAGGCLLVILFCLGLKVSLNLLFPGTNHDPIPIFFFALALGALYSRTRNLSYCILLHACLNGISLTLVWLGYR